ncbi:MAG: N-acetylmuramoyl-L-alanine amidase [Candidatus Azotimanducaceae bacterium]
MALGCLLIAMPSFAATPEQLAYELATRYTPYADGAAALDLERLANLESEIWWRTPETIRADRSADDRPLAGLHLALDPGHIGGVWAEWEWRNFRIAEDDFWVREGELVLEVAQHIRAQLTRLGAQVTLLRESHQPINPKTFIDYWPIAAAELQRPSELTLQAQVDHARAVRNRAVQLAVVLDEIAERARVVNQVIQPDALISLHINAARWPESPEGDTQQLVESDHAHVLIFGCLSQQELAVPLQQAQLAKKLINGSGAIEVELGTKLGQALAEATGQPASDYEGKNAIRINADVPYLWARNLMLLRLVDCPSVLMEPYIANSESSYVRIQKALAARAVHAPLAADDILVEYTEAVVAGILQTYGSKK